MRPGNKSLKNVLRTFHSSYELGFTESTSDGKINVLSKTFILMLRSEKGNKFPKRTSMEVWTKKCESAMYMPYLNSERSSETGSKTENKHRYDNRCPTIFQKLQDIKDKFHDVEVLVDVKFFLKSRPLFLGTRSPKKTLTRQISILKIRIVYIILSNF